MHIAFTVDAVAVTLIALIAPFSQGWKLEIKVRKAKPNNEQLNNLERIGPFSVTRCQCSNSARLRLGIAIEVLSQKRRSRAIVNISNVSTTWPVPIACSQNFRLYSISKCCYSFSPLSCIRLLQIDVANSGSSSSIRSVHSSAARQVLPGFSAKSKQRRPSTLLTQSYEATSTSPIFLHDYSASFRVFQPDSMLVMDISQHQLS